MKLAANANWTFSLRSPQARRVCLALQYDDHPETLQPMNQVDGEWRVDVSLPPRRCVAHCVVEDQTGRVSRSGPSMRPRRGF